MREAGDALFDRQGLVGDAAPGAQGVLSVASRRSRCCTSTRPGSSRRCTRCASAWPRSSASSCSCTRTPRPWRRASIRSTTAPLHTDMWKTEGLKQALDKYGFDAAFGGARRDEEKSRAKERIFSFRSAQHALGPEEPAARAVEALQRPQATRARASASSRSPTGPSSTSGNTSTWRTSRSCRSTSRAERPVVERDGTLIMVDDERMPLQPGEVPMMRKVRFRTLGCYPLTGAVESEAETLPQIIQEMLLDHHLRAPGPRDRPRPVGLDGEEEAGGVFLMAHVSRPHRRPTSTPTSRRTSTSRCCASSPAAASTTASRP